MKVITIYLYVLAIFLATDFTRAEATSDTTPTTDDKLFWGTYRPIPYVGLRSRSEDSPLVGLMWFKPSNPEGVYQLRHEACYRDDMTKYGWTQHNGESYGRQEMIDAGNQVDLTVRWVKPELDSDPNHWVLRIEGEAIPPTAE